MTNPTPTPAPKSGYQPAEWEDAMNALWLESGLFNPDVCVKKDVTKADAPVFSMVLPPPNATGTLHTGSAAMLAIEDAFTRFARMQGKRTLWLPGTDHAAIATQSKVERLLWEQEQKTRYDLGREELLRRIDTFVEKNRDIMKNQMRKMGSSLDWSREAFTLDSARHQAVYKAFKQMYDEGVIYRGDRIVNWDPKGQTTISDDEIVHKEATATFYYFQYGPFEIGTARPETKFGDKYVVMHPADERYAEYQHGQTIEIEWINGPLTTTVIKDESVDPEFGTGVMTITPWHSTVDFEIAERHGLDKEQIIDLEGKLLPIAQEFAGMHIREAREKIVDKLRTKGLVTRTEENYVHQIATAERTGEVIEPQIMRQWFVGVEHPFERNGKTTTLKTLMQEAMVSRGGDIVVLPERFEKIYFHWIDNLHDWCISRQIWYGHRIPVYYRGDEVFCGEAAPEGDDWEQDPDTLDTWFSSALWTFSTLGWGYDDTLWQAQKIYHPTTLIESGYDILFFWMSRMIMMSTFFLGESPFKTIYLHGLVRAEDGRKMSKSLDNILDPLDVINEYGTDALRLALTSGNTPGNDMRLGDEKLTAMRNLVNKIWNMSRYVKMQSPANDAAALVTPADHFIVDRLQATRKAVTEHLENYNLSLAIETLREFTVSDFADWYIEMHKIEKNTALLSALLREIITLWHPLAPFVTEAIYQDMYRDASNQNDLLLVAPYQGAPLPVADPTLVTLFVRGQQLVTDIREIRNTYGIKPQEELGIQFTAPVENTLTSLLTLVKVNPEVSGANTVTVGEDSFPALVFIDSVDIVAEKARLTKELTGAEQHLASLTTKLQNEKFMSSAPEAIRKNTELLATETTEKINRLAAALAALQ